MTKHGLILLLLCCFLVLSSSGYQSTNPPEEHFTISITPGNFVEGIDNPYLPLIPGFKYIYQTQTDEGLERVEIKVMSGIKVVMRISATTMRATVYRDGEVIEDTFNWFTQDIEGNIWYLGEDVIHYENGKLVDKAGSWEWGVDEALPGIVMYADRATQSGDPYYHRAMPKIWARY